jgi:hypothetical protein
MFCGRRIFAGEATCSYANVVNATRAVYLFFSGSVEKRIIVKFVLSVFISVMLFTSCGSETKQEEQQAPPRVNLPLAESQPEETDRSNEIQPVEKLDEATLPDLSKLGEIEKQIFLETVKRQVAYYEALEKWADHANTIKDGKAASASVRHYIKLQEEFARQLQTLDKKFMGKIDPDYAGSPEFAKVLDTYLGRPELERQTKYIMDTYIAMLQKFREDPAFKDVFAEIEKLSRESQQGVQ